MEIVLEFFLQWPEDRRGGVNPSLLGSISWFIMERRVST